MPHRVTLHHERIALHLPVPVAGLLIQGQKYIQNIGSPAGQQSFSDVDPKVSVVQATHDDLAKSEASAKLRTPGAVDARDEAEKTFRNQLTQWGHYVQKKMDEAATPEQARELAVLAGMDQPKTPVRKEKVFQAQPGQELHSIDVEVPSEGEVTYVFEASADGGKTYTLRLITHSLASCTFTNLPPGLTYWFHYQVIRGRVASDWYDPIKCTAT